MPEPPLLPVPPVVQPPPPDEPLPPPPVAALIESPRSVLGCAAIAAHPRLCALGFGAEDYAAMLGVAPDPVALALFALAARFRRRRAP